MERQSWLEVYIAFTKAVSSDSYTTAVGYVAEPGFEAIVDNKQLDYAQYTQELMRLRAALENFGRERIVDEVREEATGLLVFYRMEPLFVGELDVRGWKIQQTHRPLKIAAIDHVTFDPSAATIIRLSTTTDLHMTFGLL